MNSTPPPIQHTRIEMWETTDLDPAVLNHRWGDAKYVTDQKAGWRWIDNQIRKYTRQLEKQNAQDIQVEQWEKPHDNFEGWREYVTLFKWKWLAAGDDHIYLIAVIAPNKKPPLI